MRVAVFIAVFFALTCASRDTHGSSLIRGIHRHGDKRSTASCSGSPSPLMAPPSGCSANSAKLQAQLAGRHNPFVGYGASIAIGPVLKALECVVADILQAFPTEAELNNKTNPTTPYPGWVINATTVSPGPNDLPSLDYKMLVLNLQMLASNIRANHQPQTVPGITLVGLLGGRAALWTVDGTVGRKIHLLSIAGTQTGLDAIADLAYLPVPFSLNPLHGKVHFGFDLVAQVVYSDLKPYLNASAVGDEFLIMGHSLGASSAVLCAARAQAEHPLRSIRLLTAATPRTGDSKFMQYLNTLIPNRWHLLNVNDVVPALPLAVMPGLNGTVATFESFLERNVVGQLQTDDLIGNHLPPAYACMIASQNCAYNPYPPQDPPPTPTYRLPTYTINRVSESSQ